MLGQQEMPPDKSVFSPHDLQFLRSTRLLKGLTIDQVQCLLRGARDVRFAAGMPLLHRGKRDRCVYLLLRGSAKVWVMQSQTIVTRSLLGAQQKLGEPKPAELLPESPHSDAFHDEGQTRELIINIVGPGAVLGELSVLDGQPHCASVTALEPARALSLSGEHFLECLQAVPHIGFNIAQIVAQRLRGTVRQAEAMATLDVPGRLARQLLLLAEQHGKPVDTATGEPGILIPLRLTQSALAGMVGASRERINKVLAFFLQQGWVEYSDRYTIVLHDLDALRSRF